MGNKREAEGGKKQTIPLRPCSPPLGGHSRKASNLLAVTDGCVEAHNGRRRRVISLAAGLRQKKPNSSLT